MVNTEKNPTTMLPIIEPNLNNQTRFTLPVSITLHQLKMLNDCLPWLESISTELSSQIWDFCTRFTEFSNYDRYSFKLTLYYWSLDIVKNQQSINYMFNTISALIQHQEILRTQRENSIPNKYFSPSRSLSGPASPLDTHCNLPPIRMNSQQFQQSPMMTWDANSSRRYCSNDKLETAEILCLLSESRRWYSISDYWWEWGVNDV